MKDLSEKQMIANQTNAKLGGVKTDEGKNISRFNAVTHGILRETITDYEKLDYESLFDGLKEEYKPKTILEELVIERIVVAYIKLLRISKAESELIKETLINGHGFFIKNSFGKNDYESKINHEQIEKLSTIYSRYETATENRFYKAINKLMELKRHEQA